MFAAGEPVTIRRVEVVAEIDSHYSAGGRRVFTHMVASIVEKLCASVSLNVMRVEIGEL